MKPVPNQQAIERARNDKELLLETVEQIRKDLGELGISIEFNPSWSDPYDQLMGELVRVLDPILTQKREQFFHLLYRIDISEENVMNAISDGSGKELDGIAHLILERELKKVLFRNFFIETDQRRNRE